MSPGSFSSSLSVAAQLWLLEPVQTQQASSVQADLPHPEGFPMRATRYALRGSHPEGHMRVRGSHPDQVCIERLSSRRLPQPCDQVCIERLSSRRLPQPCDQVCIERLI